MHEQSLVRALLAQVRASSQPHPADEISEIEIAIGPLAGVEPLLVASAFELLTRGTELAGARLTIEQTPLHMKCRSCGYDYNTAELDFACPSCLSSQTVVMAGDEVILRRIVLHELASQRSEQ